MLSPTQLAQMPTSPMSTAPFDVETSRIEDHEYKDENNQHGVVTLQTEENDIEAKHVKLELKK